MLRFALIENPRAGHGIRIRAVQDLAERLRAAGHSVQEFTGTGREAARAIAEGCEVVVACGGDGTVGAVAEAIRHSGTAAALGVYPLGTLNHFAQDLGIFGLEDAARALVGGRVREIDLGLVNGHVFVNNSGIGIYPAIVRQRETVRRRGIPKWPAFVVACARAVMKLPFLRLRLEADGHCYARRTPFLFVGNNVYETGGRAIGRRGALDAGVLGVCTARGQGLAGLVRLAFHALAGKMREDREVTLFTAKTMTVRAQGKSKLHVSLDGEVRRLGTPLHYSILPRALKVLAP